MPLAVLLTLALAAMAPPSLTFTPPSAWRAQTPASSMRVAQFALPKVAGDAEDGELVVYFFGGQGGSVQANLDRWIGQMQQPGGRPSKDAAKTSTFDAHGLKVTLLDVSGTYVAETAPGATEHYDKPDFRLEAAVVETSGGPYFVKATGPAKTMAHWAPSIRTFLESVKYR